MIFKYIIIFCLLFAFSHGHSKDENKMEILEGKVKDLEDLTAKLFGKLDLADSNIQSLISENVQIKKELKDTRDQVRALEKRNVHKTGSSSSSGFQKALESLKNIKNQGQNRKIQSERRRHVRQLEAYHQSTHSIISQPVTNQGVGFTAVTTDHQTHMGINQSILFLNVIENVGNGLDPFTGVFKAPVSGLYIFSVSLLNHAGLEVRAAIVKNGNSVVNIFSGDSATYASGSNTVLLDLSINDDVWVKIIGKSDINIYGYAWSSFMGVLVS